MTSASSTSDLTGQTESMMQALADSWGLVVAMGVASILLGLAAIVWPGATLLTIAILGGTAARLLGIRL